jgi:hypothetical protein
MIAPLVPTVSGKLELSRSTGPRLVLALGLALLPHHQPEKPDRDRDDARRRYPPTHDASFPVLEPPCSSRTNTPTPAYCVPDGETLFQGKSTRPDEKSAPGA